MNTEESGQKEVKGVAIALLQLRKLYGPGCPDSTKAEFVRWIVSKDLPDKTLVAIIRFVLFTATMWCSVAVGDAAVDRLYSPVDDALGVVGIW